MNTYTSLNPTVVVLKPHSLVTLMAPVSSLNPTVVVLKLYAQPA